MKKVVLLVLVLLGLSFSGIGQEKKMKAKKHQCTEMCKDGKHVYAHGEKKHKCSEACHKTM